MRLRRLFAAGLCCVAAASFAFDLDPPETRVEPTIESFHGTTVEDSYRWLEATDAPEVADWLRAQNAFTRRVLDALPGRAALRERLVALAASDVRVKDLQWAGDRLFYLKRGPGEDSYRLYTRDSVAAPERLLVDPERWRHGDEYAAIDYFRASPNGQRVAFGISLAGREDSTLYAIDVASLQAVGEPIARARWSSPAWRFDSGALFYTQQRVAASDAPPSDALRNSLAFQRTFDADGATRDVAVLGPGLNSAVPIDPDDMPSIETSPVSPFVIGVVQHGVQRELSLYVARLTDLRGEATPWRRLAGPERGIVGFDLRGEWIYVVSSENAPRYQVMRWSLNQSRAFTPAAAEIVVPESQRVIRALSVAKEALYVTQLDEGYGRLLRLPFNPNPRKAPVGARSRSHAADKVPVPARSGEIPLPFPGAIEECVTNPLQAGALLRLASWTESPGYFAVDGRTGALARTALLPPARADFGGITSTLVRVRSHDGVEVPVSIVSARNTVRDGSARVLLDAYGAYEVSREPYFSSSLLAWLERGGVFVVAHVRGGGELGRDWHHAGFKATKANTWRDVIAVAQWLVREQWTTPARLAVSGSSAGGIAAGNAIIDRPDLFAALVSEAGFHDTLRSETGVTGPANTREFGSVADAQGFRDLLAMSTYARIRDGAAYPAALFTAGFNDPRVDVWDPAKTAARLQGVNAGPGGSGKPVLLRVDFTGGHGGGTATQLVDEYTDVFAFLLWQTGAADFTLP